MRMLASKALVQVLEEQGVRHIFGYPGAANTPILDAVGKSSIAHILMRNEQGAVHAAAGYARLTGKVGVCTATSGPGATNMITGIANAYMDSIPLVVLTGQVASGLVGRDAFQEVDTTGVTTPISKHNYLVKDPNDLPRILEEAFWIAGTGRPGPVVVDIPMDVQRMRVDYQPQGTPQIRGYCPHLPATDADAAQLADAIRQAERPLLVAGGGILIAHASEAFAALAAGTGLPVVSTMMGIGAVPCAHPRYLGMVGSHGVPPANAAFAEADLVVFLGARVSDRTVSDTEALAKRAAVAHVDIDPAEIGKNIPCDLAIAADLADFLPRLTRALAGYTCPGGWADKAAERRAAMPLPDGKKRGAVNPKYLMRRLSEATGGRAVVTTEVGQNQIWTANHYQFARPGTFLTSGGFGTMGFGLPAAMGAKLARPDELVIAIEGDGSFQMSMPELGAIRQWGAEVKIVLFVNRVLGMVHEYQDVNFQSRHSGVDLGAYPHYPSIAAAYDIPCGTVAENQDVDSAIAAMLETPGTYLLEVLVDRTESTL